MAYNVTDSADIGSKGVARFSDSSIGGIGRSGRAAPSSELVKQGSLLHGKLLDSIFLPIWIIYLN